jgi:methionyl aminopeptidase
VTVEHDDDVAALRRVGAVVAEAREAMLAAAQPGISTAELDAIGRDVLRRHGARSAPRLAYGFPGSCCIGINDRVAHGIPSPAAVLRSGDLVNVDVSAELAGYWADTGASVDVGQVAPEHRRLLEATVAAQRDAMRVARAGRPMRHIGRAVERRARKSGFSVIADLAGHGVGRGIHEPPTVSNVEMPGTERSSTMAWCLPSSRSSRPARPRSSRTPTGGRCAPSTAPSLPSSSTPSW